MGGLDVMLITYVLGKYISYHWLRSTWLCLTRLVAGGVRDWSFELDSKQGWKWAFPAVLHDMSKTTRAGAQLVRAALHKRTGQDYPSSWFDGRCSACYICTRLHPVMDRVVRKYLLEAASQIGCRLACAKLSTLDMSLMLCHAFTIVKHVGLLRGSDTGAVA